MKPVEVQPHLYRIPLCRNIDGLEGFIGSWVFDGDVTFIVDVGPRTSLSTLLDGLQELKIKRLDFIFLTHVHIDHAGATGSLIAHFPEAKVICHPLGITHLIDPQRLWEGSEEAVGELALKYGEIDPVPEQNLLSSEEFEWKDSGSSLPLDMLPITSVSSIVIGFLSVRREGFSLTSAMNSIFGHPRHPGSSWRKPLPVSTDSWAPRPKTSIMPMRDFIETRTRCSRSIESSFSSGGTSLQTK